MALITEVQEAMHDQCNAIGLEIFQPLPVVNPDVNHSLSIGIEWKSLKLTLYITNHLHLRPGVRICQQDASMEPSYAVAHDHHGCFLSTVTEKSF